MGSGYSKMKKQAKLFSAQMEKTREEMQKRIFEGQSGNGLVKVFLNGEKQMQSIKISPDCVDKEDVEGLQDLLVAAFEDAYKKIEEESSHSSLGNPLGFGF